MGFAGICTNTFPYASTNYQHHWWQNGSWSATQIKSENHRFDGTSSVKQIAHSMVSNHSKSTYLFPTSSVGQWEHEFSRRFSRWSMEWGHSAHLYTYIISSYHGETSWFWSQIPFSMKNSPRFQTVALPNAPSSVFSHRKFQWSTPLIPRNPNCQSFFFTNLRCQTTTVCFARPLGSSQET